MPCFGAICPVHIFEQEFIVTPCQNKKSNEESLLNCTVFTPVCVGGGGGAVHIFEQEFIVTPCQNKSQMKRHY